jgi:hypothetical protein
MRAANKKADKSHCLKGVEPQSLGASDKSSAEHALANANLALRSNDLEATKFVAVPQSGSYPASTAGLVR